MSDIEEAVGRIAEARRASAELDRHISFVLAKARQEIESTCADMLNRVMAATDEIIRTERARGLIAARAAEAESSFYEGGMQDA